MSESVTLDLELKSPIGRVWHALTDAATLSKWMMFETNDFRPVVGHKFQFRAQPNYGGMVIDCEVLEVDEPNRLSYTWVGGPEDNLVETKVTWMLTESAGGITRLQLEQSGFASDAKQAIGGAKYGWSQMLDQLQSMLASH